MKRQRDRERVAHSFALINLYELNIYRNHAYLNGGGAAACAVVILQRDTVLAQPNS